MTLYTQDEVDSVIEERLGEMEARLDILANELNTTKTALQKFAGRVDDEFGEVAARIQGE